jgi:hypothetical protein
MDFEQIELLYALIPVAMFAVVCFLQIQSDLDKYHLPT